MSHFSFSLPIVTMKLTKKFNKNIPTISDTRFDVHDWQCQWCAHRRHSVFDPERQRSVRQHQNRIKSNDHRKHTDCRWCTKWSWWVETVDLCIAMENEIIKIIQGNGVRQASGEVNAVLGRISDAVGNNSYRHFEQADEYIQEYYKYVYYGGIALSSVLLLVLLCVVLGLLCGICGKRPDGYGDDCCNKGAGSRFLMMCVMNIRLRIIEVVNNLCPYSSGVAVIFLTISILTVVALVYFLAGMVVRRGVCVSLQWVYFHKASLLRNAQPQYWSQNFVLPTSSETQPKIKCSSTSTGW